MIAFATLGSGEAKLRESAGAPLFGGGYCQSECILFSVRSKNTVELCTIQPFEPAYPAGRRQKHLTLRSYSRLAQLVFNDHGFLSTTVQDSTKRNGWLRTG
eukprot:105930-Pleurochrysis_carterae.AAC.1